MPYIVAYRYTDSDPWVLDHDMVYDIPKEAADQAKMLNSNQKMWGGTVRYRVRPLNLEDPAAWKFRERAKFVNETYNAPPWGHNPDGMLEHIDPDNPTQIRFYASDQDAQRNRFTSMAPGRFYVRYIDTCPRDGVVEKYCAQMGLDMVVSKLKLAKTADEFEFVYTNGPHSCMAYPMDQQKYRSDIHPVRCYGDLDLACAYIERAGEITARCLVWPERKIHGRIYGDRHRLLERLKENDYIENWDFSGARLHVHMTKQSEITAPYVDGDDLGAILEGEYFVLTNQPHIIMKGADGLIFTDGCGICGAMRTPLEWNDDDDCYACGEHS